MTEVLREYGAVMPCGGMGTRLEAVTGGLPKSLCPIGGRELITYSLESMDPSLVKHLVFALGHAAEDIRAWVGAQVFSQEVTFSEQAEPGVLEAIRTGAQHIRQEAFIACNTDEIRTNLRLANAVAHHEASGALATMVTTTADHIFRHRLVDIDPKNRATTTWLKPMEFLDDPDTVGRVNTGFLILEQGAIEHFDPDHSKDWSGLIDPLCDAGELNVYHQEDLAFFNVGTLQEYAEAAIFLEQNT